MKALKNYVIVELKKQTTTTTKTKSGIYVLNQEKTDTTRDGDKVVTTDVTVIDVGNHNRRLVVGMYQVFSLGQASKRRK